MEEKSKKSGGLGLLSDFINGGQRRKMQGGLWGAVYGLAALTSLYHLYRALAGISEPTVHRWIHLVLFLMLAFLCYTPTKRSPREKLPVVDLVLVLLAVSVLVYLLVDAGRLLSRWPGAQNLTPLDFFFGLLLIFLALEASRRVLGFTLTFIALLFIIYSYAGNYLPWIFKHAGFSVKAIVDHLFLTQDGIFGMPIGVSSTYIVLFVLFGNFLQASGTGEFFFQLANALTGHTRGGPAKVAVISSALFGSISGSTVANVVTTGSVTIPTMKRAGYQPYFAGAVEAAASSGGTIMPPVMGAVAFLMAEMINMPYIKVAAMSAIPSLLYYLGIYVTVHLEAVKTGMKAMPREEIIPFRTVLYRGWPRLVPLAMLIWLMVTGFSPFKSAFYSILATIAMSFLYRENRLTPSRIVNVLNDSAKTAIPVVVASAMAAILVGTVALTGLGGRFASFVMQVAGGSLFLALLFTALASVLVGTGVPISASYVMVAVLAAPALIKIGVMIPVAHLFVLYYAALAEVTPPVSLAAFAAAGIAGADFSKVGWTAFRLALVGFIIPFIFVYQPVLVLQGNLAEGVFAIATAVIGVMGLMAGFEGYYKRKMLWWERVLFIGGGLLLIIPGLATDGIGLVAIIVSFLSQKYYQNVQPKGPKMVLGE